jgi:hypothetical protein
LSQGVEIAKGVYLNGPGPDRIRRHGVSLIVIVTDFIGTGSRVCTMLEKFMRVPSIRSWRSNHWIEFAVAAAAATAHGVAAVQGHRSKAKVYTNYLAASLKTYPDQAAAQAWKTLALNYGPRHARGSNPLGYKDLGALIAFSYRAPNNLPLLFHEGNRAWKPLFRGPISTDMAPAFGLQSPTRRTALAAAALSQDLPDDLVLKERQVLLVLLALRGRWRSGQEIEFAERTGLGVPEILDARAYALKRGLLTSEGRLTDAGQALVHAGTSKISRVPEIPTRTQPYYPKALRAPR